jgi:hypothetical protein
VINDVRTAQRAGATSFSTLPFSISDSFHVKELREFWHGGLVKGCPSPLEDQILFARMIIFHLGLKPGEAEVVDCLIASWPQHTVKKPFQDLRITGLLRDRCHVTEGSIARVYFQLSEPV